jgi:hypothetical protein
VTIGIIHSFIWLFPPGGTIRIQQSRANEELHLFSQEVEYLSPEKEGHRLRDGSNTQFELMSIQIKMNSQVGTLLQERNEHSEFDNYLCFQKGKAREKDFIFFSVNWFP